MAFIIRRESPNAINWQVKTLYVADWQAKSQPVYTTDKMHALKFADLGEANKCRQDALQPEDLNGVRYVAEEV